jgi:hypothetical protein
MGGPKYSGQCVHQDEQQSIDLSGSQGRINFAVPTTNYLQSAEIIKWLP